jgi:hypothetical protein
MGKVLDSIDESIAEFIASQKMFFVATAPLSASGSINLSPKGLPTFVQLGPTEVAYLDLTGSGAETIAHLRENGRIVLMFCAFEGPPNIVRLHGSGRVVTPPDEEFASLLAHFEERHGVRSVIVVRVHRVSTSCGYAVPLLDFVRERDQLDRWAEKKGKDGLVAYRDGKNRTSIDGLPALHDDELGSR